MLWDLGRYDGAEDYDGLLRMKAGRPPPMSPTRVAAELREGVRSGAIAFTAAADVDLVIGIYERGFRTAFETFNSSAGDCNGRVVFYQHLGWTDAETPTIAEAVRYIQEHCDPDKGIAGTKGGGVYLHFGDNDFTDAGKQTLRALSASQVKVQV